MMDITSMIAAEDDAKQRAFLIVLNSINMSLVANTATIRDISSKLETHLDNFEVHTAAEEALLNKGKGAWKVMAWVVGLVQSLALALWLTISADVNNIHISVQESRDSTSQLGARVLVLESKK
jgi:hypothetical protein